ncbi:g8223 [Coccomyxa elongata]
MAKLNKVEKDLLDQLVKQKEQSKGGYLTVKKRKLKRKSPGPKRRARDLVEEFGLCPISLQPMRRPVLPSSGQAYDEINIVRFCSSGKKQCPVSGAALECHRKGADKGKVMLTPDYALRNVIRHQALQAEVYIPPIDKDELLKEMHGFLTPDAPSDDFATIMPTVAKAVVDDTHLGYIKLIELEELLESFQEAAQRCPGSCAAEAFPALVAECFACRVPHIVDMGVEMLPSETAWSCSRVLREALSVGQDPDCRGQVLVAIEKKFKEKAYTAAQARAVLTFDTESVPVQQFQARCADHILFTSNTGLQLTKAESEEVMNAALRVADELSGCDSNRSSGYALWSSALTALHRRGRALDSENLERLFWRDNRHVLATLAGSEQELLQWHLNRQPSKALSLCIEALAYCADYSDGFHQGDSYSDGEEDFLGSDEEDDIEGFPNGLPRMRTLTVHNYN